MDSRTRKLEAEYGRRATEYTANQLKVQGKGKKDEIFPTIKLGSPEWRRWEAYFREYLGFDPLAMQRVRAERQESMTVPTQWPEWFDSSYTADKGGHYSPPDPELPRIDDAPVEWANVFMPAEVPMYAKAYELARAAEPRESRPDPDGRAGLWVSLRIARAAGAQFGQR